MYKPPPDLPHARRTPDSGYPVPNGKPRPGDRRATSTIPFPDAAEPRLFRRRLVPAKPGEILTESRRGRSETIRLPDAPSAAAAMPFRRCARDARRNGIIGTDDALRSLRRMHCVAGCLPKSNRAASPRWAFANDPSTETPPSPAFSGAAAPFRPALWIHAGSDSLRFGRNDWENRIPWWLRQMAIYGRAERRNVSRIILENRTYEHGPFLALADA
jgi:hypothetical protein